MTDPTHLSYNDLLAENRRLQMQILITKDQRDHQRGILTQIGYYSEATTFCSLNLTDSQRDTLGRACELSMKSPEETIHAALECWLDYRAACKANRNPRAWTEAEAEGKFGT